MSSFVRAHRLVVILGALGSLALAGTATAYWLADGSGTATTVLPDPLPLTFAPGLSDPQLYPGGSAGVTIIVSNRNDYFLRLAGLTLDTDEVPDIHVDAGHSAGCASSSLGFIDQDNGGQGWDVPPRAGGVDGTLSIELPGAITMSAAADNGCQGATFDVEVVASD